MTNRTLLEATTLVGAATLILSAGLAITLSPWFLGLTVGALLALAGLAAILRSATRLRAVSYTHLTLPTTPYV